MRKIVALIIMGFSWAGFSQIIPPAPEEKGVVEAPVSNSTNDSIINGNASDYITLTGKTIHRFVAENFSYPDQALDEGITGTIYVDFVVEKDGTVQQATIRKSVCKECDLEAIRVVKRLRLKPILIDGKPERIRFRIPIRLALE
ncbi:energy transducer TonB [Flavobacterium sp. CBA20B-1]|uniref:energy transducer TonB n=1 Tax=unclassified Flavobacterium TaxID=196869 RepID=UPI00222526DF|nr:MULTISPECIES: energy transducer TonB [unclassified Flavobacterium]WCM40935.1 energy transducer TonB [Flavobacterium sp. CBA20B-1]